MVARQRQELPRLGGAQAARIVFALSPNSAACERVFSLVKRLFGEQQMDSLSDYLNAALKLNFNGRTVG